MKHNFLRFLTLTALIFGSLSLWASTQYCETASGHLGNADFGDRNACVKLSISKSSEANYIDVKVAMNRELSATSKIDYLYVLYGGLPYTAGTDDNGDAFDELTAHVNVGGATLGSLMIQYSNPSWGGRWQIDLSDVDFTASCSAGPSDDEAPTITSASLVSKTHNSVVLSVAGTDNVAVTKYVVKNGSAELGSYNPADDKITITGLTPNTAYTLNVYAKDAAGNVSSNYETVNVTTDAFVYYQYATGHLGNASFGDANGRILLTLEKKSEKSIQVTVAPNNAGTIVDWTSTTINGVNKVVGTKSASSTQNIEPFIINYANDLPASFSVTIEWHTPSMGGDGAWTTQAFTVNKSELYVGPVSDLEDPELTITEPSAAAIELALNATKQITWTSSNTETPTFTSSNSAAVEVSDAGLITANAIGSATITVKQDETDTYQEATQTITVTVAGDKSKNTECSGWDNDIWASEGGYTYAFSTSGTTVHIEFTAIGNFPGGFTNPQVYFPNTNEFKSMTKSGNVLSFDFANQTIGNDLKIQGYFPREAGADQTQVYIYTVGEDCQPHAVEDVSITSTFTEIEVGQAMTMTAAVTPANATNKNVTWSITSGSGATINASTGLLTGEVAGGSVTVQVETVDGGFTATKTITIIAAKPSAPSALPTAPTLPANKVKAVYSATYSADCGFGEWGSSTAYTQDTYGKKYVMTGSGYFGMEIAAQGSGLNCSSMEYLHADVWVKDNKSIRFVPIHGGTEYGVTKQLTGGQWNSIDIPLDEGDWVNITNWSDVYQIKIDNAPYLTLWFNNVYFYTTAEETKYAVSAIAGDGGSATVSASSVTSGTEVTFTATAKDCGYMFSSWTKGGEVIVGAEATYTTAITEETTLTANFTTTFAPVTPTHDAANVMTVYGDYGKQTGLNVCPWWDSQTTQYNETTIGGKKMARYTKINFQGMDFDANRMDVSGMQYVHLDLYASVESYIKFSLIWAATEQAVTKHLNGCTMESLDIPLSEFTNADFTTIRQLKFDAQGLSLAGHVLIVQNIYFYKLPSAPVESVTITNAPSEMAVNSDLTLSATIAPVNAGNKNVTWSITAGSDCATIDHSTGVLHATSEGQVTVQVTTEDGNKTDSKTITIKAADEPVFPFTDDPTGDQLTQLSAWLSHYNGQIVDFTLPRSLSSSYFNTICLPFGLSSFADTPFEGATVAALVDATVEGMEGSLALTLVFQPVTSMAAGVPYIIQPASDLTNPRFDDVVVSVTEARYTQVGNVKFIGSLAPIDVTNWYQNVFLAANDELRWNNTPTTIKGYRGYFAITGVVATSPMRANAPRLVIRNTPTEMQNAESTLRSEKVIRNGQLVIIRNGVEYNAQGQVIQ